MSQNLWVLNKQGNHLCKNIQIGFPELLSCPVWDVISYYEFLECASAHHASEDWCFYHTMKSQDICHDPHITCSWNSNDQIPFCHHRSAHPSELECGADNVKVVDLITVWAIQLRVGLDDPSRSLPTQTIPWFCVAHISLIPFAIDGLPLNSLYWSFNLGQCTRCSYAFCLYDPFQEKDNCSPFKTSMSSVVTFYGLFLYR